MLKTTPETCAKQSCLLVQLETWHLSREWLRGGNPFKFAHKLLTKFVKGVLQSCQICWHFSLSLLEKGLHPSFIYSWFKELLCLANWSIKISSNHASTPKTRQGASDWSLHLFCPWNTLKSRILYQKWRHFCHFPGCPNSPNSKIDVLECGLQTTNCI